MNLPKKKMADITIGSKQYYDSILDSEGMKELAHWIESKPINDNIIRVLCEFLRGEKT
jgi:hypothetical protein